MPGAAYLRGRYQHVRVIGWDEFWLQALGNLLAGDVFFTEEESLGADALRGAFSGTDYTRRLLGVGFEYRYSFWRDVFKLGVFTNLAVYQPIEAFTDRGVGARFAASAGPGRHSRQPALSRQSAKGSTSTARFASSLSSSTRRR